ncbi:hypothetical protein P0136_12660 [Lentisphaerota bacterium ZTH]|nr:hypothetical protein JYG24_09825 [Lentisphaerota bacterium]WET06210.1 hypothetical protein P0136_12660 [Lentisphaerota bacterium ZTH]
MFFKSILADIIEIWNLLFAFPIKQRFNSDEISEYPRIIVSQLWFPVIGLVLGLIYWLFGNLTVGIFGVVSGSILFSFCFTLLTILKDGGRGLAGMSAMVEFACEKVPMDQSLLHLPDSVRKVKGPFVPVTIILVVLLKLLCFFLMAYYGYVYWAIAIFVLSMTIRGHLAAMPDLASGEPMIKVQQQQRFFVWILAAFLVLFVLIKAPFTSLIGYGITFVLAIFLEKFIDRQVQGTNPNITNFAGETAEIILLLTGMLLLTAAYK